MVGGGVNVVDTDSVCTKILHQGGIQLTLILVDQGVLCAQVSFGNKKRRAAEGSSAGLTNQR